MLKIRKKNKFTKENVLILQLHRSASILEVEKESVNFSLFIEQIEHKKIERFSIYLLLSNCTPYKQSC